MDRRAESRQELGRAHVVIDVEDGVRMSVAREEFAHAERAGGVIGSHDHDVAGAALNEVSRRPINVGSKISLNSGSAWIAASNFVRSISITVLSRRRERGKVRDGRRASVPSPVNCRPKHGHERLLTANVVDDVERAFGENEELHIPRANFDEHLARRHDSLASDRREPIYLRRAEAGNRDRRRRLSFVHSVSGRGWLTNSYRRDRPPAITHWYQYLGVLRRRQRPREVAFARDRGGGGHAQVRMNP